ncbi:MAG TPA: DUF2934 domain-containing protein [Spirochaetota bacterium]|nr:DUF2934 domain-containing protein [Spirochaetota bacterium]HOL56935.1 DUF2934 domain-containing protein [Spirochaetota bacterium]HPP04489.1 DUF2934 domain-containing protein [Spirochaetota bacterium]
MKQEFLLCTGINCPFKEDCYRFLIEPSPDSEFLGKPPYDKSLNYCSFFLKIPFFDEEYIKTKAYYLWVKNGCKENDDLGNWYKAKKEIFEESKKFIKKEYHSKFDIILKE